MVLGKLLDIRNIHLNKLDEFLSHETYITLKSENKCFDEVLILQDHVALFFLAWLACALEVAVVEDQVQETDDVYLHCLVSLYDALFESLYQRVYYLVTDLVSNIWIWILLNLLQD